jgi:two-component system, chemotaxis family, CheB/CheR fusion protein
VSPKKRPAKSRKPAKALPPARPPEPSGDGSQETEKKGQVAEKALQTIPIVGIGASAGGLAAYEAFFSGMPTDTTTGMAFVLVQHLSPDHKSMLGELVRRYTRMEVIEVQDGMHPRADCAYIIPPNRDMALVHGRLRLLEPAAPRGQRLPIDFFFRSLAEELHEHAICVVLSGTGSDGTLGLRAIKGEGGMAMVQSPETTEHDGMPRSAMATGLVDYILPPAEMVQQIIRYVRHAFQRPRGEATALPATDGSLKSLTSLLRAQTGHDFSQYKSNTLVRRMERRMALHQIEHPAEYLQHARENPTEVEALFRDLLIGVTNFFRDPEAFAVLEEKVIPRLFAERSVHDGIRVWICGSSTGEEAYSIAILLQEQLEILKRPYRVQVFATDIDRQAIDTARAGVFPASIAADVKPERLARYFVHNADRSEYRVQKVIRDLLVFSEQDVLKDPPFSRLDLISCRNLVIYLNSDAQRKLIPLFHYALNPGGVLFLGSSETIGEFSKLFSVVDRKWKLYQKEPIETAEARAALGEFVPVFQEPHTRVRHRLAFPPHEQGATLRQLTEQALLSHYSDAALLINTRGEILYILGRTGHYLEPPTGDPSMNILAMAREGLRREITTALHKVVTQKQPVEYRGLRVKTNGDYASVNLTVRPARSPMDGGPTDMYLVIIQEGQVATDADRAMPETPGTDQDERVRQLEQDLRAKEDYLQTTLEEMETTNEELKSTNEEMQSVNEELQSTNEELETSKEELQSVNEELSTVNAELQDKVAELSRANNDMNNLLAGTGVGTVFVDHQLRISRFTPAVTQVINLITSDIGRPVEHMASNLVGNVELADGIREVLTSLGTKEAEVRTKSGTWYLMRIRPYRTMSNVIEGAVLTFVDISERKKAEESLAASEARFQSLFNSVQAGLAQADPTGRFLFVNDQLCESLGYGKIELLRLRMQDVVHPDDRQRTAVLLDALIAGGPDFQIERRNRRKDGSFQWVTDRVSAIRDGRNGIASLVSVTADVSERKRLEAEAAATDEQLNIALEALSRIQALLPFTITPKNRLVVLEEILDAAITITDADMGAIQLCLPPDDQLRVVAQRGFGQEYVDYWNRSGQGDGSGALAVKSRERVIVEDVKQSPIFVHPPSLEVQLAAGVQAVQSTPLFAQGGNLLGVISTHFRSPQRPDDRRLRFFDLLVRQATEIVERGREALLKDLKP